MDKPLVFIPGRKFPSISITGSRCWLNCSYCMGYYLRSMDHVLSPKELYDLARYYWKNGAIGMLISGGFTRDGRLPIEPYLPVIKDIKNDFNLIINLHIGIVDRKLASNIRYSKIDIVDYEFILNNRVIKDIKHLDKDVDDYIKGYEALINYGPDYIVPHIPLGLKYGTIDREYMAIDILSDYDPYLTVFLIFTPTKNTPMSHVKPPKTNDILDVIYYGRRRLNGEIALGCMRPWALRYVIDEILIKNRVINRIVNPPRKLINKYDLRVIEACCSVPQSILSAIGYRID